MSSGFGDAGAQPLVIRRVVGRVMATELGADTDGEEVELELGPDSTTEYMSIGRFTIIIQLSEVGSYLLH
jgi:hypothetical protein